MQGIAVGSVVAELLEAAHKRCGNLALPSVVSARTHLCRGLTAAVVGESRIYGSIGVDLRTPFHKVGRLNHSHSLLPLGKLPCGHPHAVGRPLHQLGLKHLFHVAPRAEIGVYERVALVQLVPFHAVGTPGELQSAVSVRIGIRENKHGIRAIGMSRQHCPCRSRDNHAGNGPAHKVTNGYFIHGFQKSCLQRYLIHRSIPNIRYGAAKSAHQPGAADTQM